MKFFLRVLVLFTAAALAPSLYSQPAQDSAATASAEAEPRTKASTEKRSTVHVPKLESTIVIDGRPDEQAWKNAAVFNDFLQTYPGDNTAPSKPTEFRMMYDEKNLYVAWKCWDEKDKIRATVATRDNVFGEDNVRMWLDTYNDQRRAYIFGFNPLGVQQDGIYTEGRGADFSIDVVMESKGVIEDWGWSVEVKIPFKSLRYKTGKGTIWGFNVARNIDRLNDEFDQWMPDDRNVSGFLIKHGKISGLDDIKYERTLEVVPSVTFSQTGSRVAAREIEAGRFVNRPLQNQIGVTLKYTVTPSITLDAAINPDFAEIEADAPVVTANQRFPIFFQEKRPFFLEGAEIFTSPLQVFYSRNIVDPDVALKLSGKTGKTSFGALIASDNAPGNYSEDERTLNLQCLERQRLDPRIQCSRDEFVDKNSTFAVVRVKRDFGAENNIGFFGTYRAFPEQKNLLAGFDGRFKFNPKLSAQFQLVATTSKRCFFDPYFEPTANQQQAASNRSTCGTGTYDTALLPSDTGLLNNRNTYNQYRIGNGIGYYLNLDYTQETHGWFLEAGGRTKFYRADSGFTRRVDDNFAFFFNRFSTKSDSNKKIIRAQWNQSSGVNYNGSGNLTSFNVETSGSLNLQRNTFVNLSVGTSFEKIFETEFGLARSATREGTFVGPESRSSWQQFISGNFDQTPHKRLSYGIFLGGIRNALDFFNYVCIRNCGADNAEFKQDPGPGQQLDAQVYLNLKPTDPWTVNLSYTKSRLTRFDNRLRSFDSDILSARSTYYFTRFLFTRFRLDYDGTDKRYAGQALFGWTPSPGTALYAGYNDDLNRNGINPFTEQFEPGFNRNGRTFFIRMSYLFRKSF